MNADILARWLCASKEFVNRTGPYLELDDEYDDWILRHLEGSLVSPHDLAEAILQFLQEQEQ